MEKDPFIAVDKLMAIVGICDKMGVKWEDGVIHDWYWSKRSDLSEGWSKANFGWFGNIL